MTAPQSPRHPVPGEDLAGSNPYPAGRYAAGPVPSAATPGPVPTPGGSYAPRQPATEGHDSIGEVSVGELVGNVTRDLSTLMRQELALAQAEVKAEVGKAGKAAGALGAAGFAGYMAVLFLSISLWWALGHLIGNGWSALVVAVLWGIVGAVLYSTGRKKLQEVNPTPERTVDTLKNVPDALKGELGGHR